jgi:hypothetical protein
MGLAFRFQGIISREKTERIIVPWTSGVTIASPTDGDPCDDGL